MVTFKTFNLIIVFTLTASLAASCRKKSADEEASDLGGGGSTTVVTGTQTVSDGTTGTVSGDGDIEVVSADKKPPVPGNSGTIAVDTVSSTKVKISWTAATDNQGAVSYDVYSAAGIAIDTLNDLKVSGVTRAISQTKELTFEFTSLTASTSYTFNVVARDKVGNTAIYKSVTQTTSSAAGTPVATASTSIVSILSGASTMPSGTSVTIQLRAKDASGADMTTGGSVVTFTKSGGTSTFTQSFPLTATDNGNGTYTATITGSLAGTASTFGAKIGATAVTSTTSLAVTPGTISASTSQVSIVGGASSVANGASVTVKLQAKDAAGNNLSTGGAAVSFSKTGGTSTFTQSFALAATDNGDGTYTATLTGNAAGTAATIGALIGVTPVVSTVSLGVSSGAASTGTSIVSINGGATTVSSGSNVTVKLQAKDSAGNNLTSGGSTVTFTKTGGTSTFTQSFPLAATDVGDGTYTAVLTGNAAGTATTLGATIGGAPVTSTTGMTVNSGTISTATSVVSIVSGASTVNSGSSVTARLQAKDAAGNNLSAGGSTVTFTLAGGTSTFTQSSPVTATDNGDGTYTATLTGNVSGTAKTVGAKIGASTVTSTTTMTVNPGTIAAATSTVAIVGGASTVASGSTVTVRLTAKDAAGNTITTGGGTVAFVQSAGTSSFNETFPVAATDNSNGTYTATLTGDMVGTAATIGATVSGVATASTTSLTVTPGTISTANSVVSIVGGASTLASGSNATVRLQAKDAAGNNLTAGGATVTFTKTGGTTTFTQSFALAATDAGNGTYTATLTGNASGTATTLGATIGGSGVTSTTTLSVIPGPISTATSVVTAGSATVPSGVDVEIKLTARDAANNLITAGGSTVTFTQTGGTSTFSQSFPVSASDNADGTYTANITGVTAGTAKTIGAKIGASTVTSTVNVTVSSSVGATISGQPTGTNNTTTLNITVAGTNVTQYKYKVGLTASTDCSNATGYSASIPVATPISTDISGQGDGATTLCVIGADVGNNWQAEAAATTATWTKKATPPSFTSLALANEAADGYINAADKVLTSSLGGTLVASAYTTAAYRLVTSATTCDVALVYGSMPINTSGNFGADGNYKICVKLTDTAGNAPAYGASGTIVLKATAPAFTSLARANEAADGYINAADKLLTSALASTLVGTGYDTAAYKLVSSGTTCNGSLTYGSMPQNDSGDFGADGTYKVCAQLSDNAGNTSAYGATSTITLKTAAPAFTSLALANNATDGYVNAAEKLLTNALAGSISGSNYDTAAYKLVSSGTTCNNALTYGAMPVGTSGDFGSDGTYKVCAALTDSAGNATAYGSTSNITLKTSLPAFTSLTIANDAADGYINAAEKLLTNALAGSISGSNYDTAAYKLVTSATTCNVALTYGSMPADNSADFGSDGNYKVCVKLTDNAGNTPAYGASGTIALKNTAPSFTSLALANEAANGYINIAEKLLTNALAGSLSASSYDTAAYKLVTSATTCNVALTYGSMPADNSADFGSDGTYKVCTKLTDTAGNPAAYGASSTFTLDTVAPTTTISSLEPNPTNVSPYLVSVDFSETVTGFISTDITVGNGSLSGFSGSAASYSFNLTPSGQVTSTVNVSASVAQDVAGNNNTVATQLSRAFDNVAPTVSGGVTSADADATYTLGQTITITVTFSDTVYVTGTPTLSLNTTPARSATYSSGHGSSVLSFTYSPSAGDSSADLDYASTSALSGTIKDNAGNSATLTLAAPGASGSLGFSKNLVVDTNAATITNVDTTLPNGSYPAGTVIPIRLNFSEAVDVTGTPTLALNTSPAQSATYSSGTGTTSLVFNYTVQAGDTAGVLNYASTSALALAGGTILDAALNNAFLTLPGLASGSSLGDLATITVDTTSGSVTNVTSTTADGSYSIGEGIDVDVSFNEPVVVTGSPRIQLNVTNTAVTTRYATYTSGSGTGTLVFSYVVQGPNNVNGDMAADLNYFSTASLTLNGGTIKDLAGNNAGLTLPATNAAGSLGTNKDITIDSSLAAVLGISGVPCCAVSALKASATELTVTFPADVSAYNNVKVYRASGGTPPSSACNVGTLVTTINSFSGGTSQTVVDSTGGAGKTYSYRVCAFDGGGGAIESATTSNIVSNTLHWMFTTKNAVASGNLGGVSGANATCQTAGNTIDSTLTWLAVLSDSTMEAAGRLPVAGTIYNRNATIASVATNYNDLWNGSIAAAIQYAQDGTSQTGSAWTGSTSAGLRAATTCSDWASSSAGVTGGNATVTSLTATWAANTTSACNTATNRLYCFSKAMEPLTSFSVATPGSGTDGDVSVTIDFPADTTLWTKAEVRRLLGAVPPTCSTGTVAKTYNGPTFTDETFTDPTAKASAFFSYAVCVYNGTNVAASYTKTGLPVRTYHATASHIAFITSTTYNGNLGGLAGADAKCQTQGNTFTSGKTWKAILSSSATNANSAGRIAATGPIRNVNGGLVASTNADLFDASISSQINYTDTFVTTTGMAWTGSTSAGAVGTKHCTDWTNSSGGGNTGVRGSPASLTATWIANSTNKCNVLLRLYCMSTTAD